MPSMKSRSAAKLVTPDDDPMEVREDGTRLPGSAATRLHTRVVPKSRVFLRQQGCWNCMNFDNGALAQSHLRRRKQLDMRMLLERGRTLEEAEDVLARVGAMLRTPDFGVCLAGGASAEFVGQTYLCHRWRGRVAIEGKADALVEEIYDKKGEKL